MGADVVAYLLDLKSLLSIGFAVALGGGTAFLLNHGRRRRRISHVDVGHVGRKLESKIIIRSFRDARRWGARRVGGCSAEGKAQNREIAGEWKVKVNGRGAVGCSLAERVLCQAAQALGLAFTDYGFRILET
jgi:hypothetical protein